MQLRSESKYVLKDLHQEIGLLDRKIAHCEKFEKFESDKERATALQKLVRTRKMLVNSAEKMAQHGVEFDAKDLPRSLKEQPAPAKVL